MGKFVNLNRIKEQAKLIKTLANRVIGDIGEHCEALKDYPYYSLPTGVPRKNADTGGHYALAAGAACAVENAGLIKGGRSNMSNEELKTIEEIKQLANIIDVSAKELQTGLRNLLIAKESGCSWFWIPRRAKVKDDISFLRCKLMELSKMLDE